MNIFAFSDEVIKEINEKKNVYIDTLIGGSLTKMEDYRFIMGKLHGINEAKVIIESFLKSLETPKS